MAFVMEIKSEVFGSCVEEIDVSVEVENSEAWLCCGWKYLSCFGAEKWLKIGGGGRRWCQVSDGVLGALGLIEEMKSPCGGRGFREID